MVNKICHYIGKSNDPYRNLAIEQYLMETVGEDNFGLTYNIFDEVHSGEPKPAAITLAKYINGEDYDITPLYKFAKKQR